MTRFTKRLGLLTVAAATAILVVGVATASAQGRGGAKSVSTGALVTEAAKQLSVARPDLKAAIVQSAEDHVDAAVEDEDVTSDEGDQLKADIEDNLNVAYQVSQTRTVAATLKITTKDLNAGFRAARKALAAKAIDTALANGDITADQATAAKTALDSKTFAGYKSRRRREPDRLRRRPRRRWRWPVRRWRREQQQLIVVVERHLELGHDDRHHDVVPRTPLATKKVRFTRGPPSRAALGVPHSDLSARAHGLPRAG